MQSTAKQCPDFSRSYFGRTDLGRRLAAHS